MILLDEVWVRFESYGEREEKRRETKREPDAFFERCRTVASMYRNPKTPTLHKPKTQPHHSSTLLHLPTIRMTRMVLFLVRFLLEGSSFNLLVENDLFLLGEMTGIDFSEDTVLDLIDPSVGGAEEEERRRERECQRFNFDFEQTRRSFENTSTSVPSSPSFFLPYASIQHSLSSLSSLTSLKELRDEPHPETVVLLSKSGLLLNHSTSHLTLSCNLASSSVLCLWILGAGGKGRKEVEEIWKGAVVGR